MGGCLHRIHVGCRGLVLRNGVCQAGPAPLPTGPCACRRVEKRRREQQQFMWLIARGPSHEQHADSSAAGHVAAPQVQEAEPLSGLRIPPGPLLPSGSADAVPDPAAVSPAEASLPAHERDSLPSSGIEEGCVQCLSASRTHSWPSCALCKPCSGLVC